MPREACSCLLLTRIALHGRGVASACGDRVTAHFEEDIHRKQEESGETTIQDQVEQGDEGCNTRKISHTRHTSLCNLQLTYVYIRVLNNF